MCYDDDGASLRKQLLVVCYVYHLRSPSVILNHFMEFHENVRFGLDCEWEEEQT